MKIIWSNRTRLNQEMMLITAIFLQETELASLGSDGAKDGLTTPILKSPIDGSFLDSIKMQPESFMASTELALLLLTSEASQSPPEAERFRQKNVEDAVFSSMEAKEMRIHVLKPSIAIND
uniref:Uncharacterized protein n=1 Tax=Salix viminalis TaxID=40686 RepID=A0A6N2MMS5_SALVM